MIHRDIIETQHKKKCTKCYNAIPNFYAITVYRAFQNLCAESMLKQRNGSKIKLKQQLKLHRTVASATRVTRSRRLGSCSCYCSIVFIKKPTASNEVVQIPTVSLLPSQRGIYLVYGYKFRPTLNHI